MKRLLQTVFWFTFSLSVILFIAVSVIGEPAVFKHSAEIKPYAHVFATGSVLRDADPTSDTLIFFLGDSSVAQPPWATEGGPGIPKLLEEELRLSRPGLGNLSVLEWSFAGGRPFHYYCLLFEAAKYRPALLVVPINWRTLGPVSREWNKKFAFHELSASVPLSERRAHREIDIMHAENISRRKQIFSLPVRPLLYVYGLKIWARDKLRMDKGDSSEPFSELSPEMEGLITRFSDGQLFEQYANVIEEDNAQVAVLRELADASTRRGIRLLFYITPIHLHEMRQRSCFNPARFQQSADTIVRSLSSEYSQCLNLSALLEEEDFIDNFEHYTAAGNRKIALALAAAIPESIEAPPAPAPALSLRETRVPGS
jgi:hypothetical protein